MLVIADSSPLIALVNIGHVEVLPKLFGQVVIPPAETGPELGGEGNDRQGLGIILHRLARRVEPASASVRLAPPRHAGAVPGTRDASCLAFAPSLC